MNKIMGMKGLMCRAKTKSTVIYLLFKTEQQDIFGSLTYFDYNATLSDYPVHLTHYLSGSG